MEQLACIPLSSFSLTKASEGLKKHFIEGSVGKRGGENVLRAEEVTPLLFLKADLSAAVCRCACTWVCFSKYAPMLTCCLWSGSFFVFLEALKQQSQTHSALNKTSELGPSVQNCRDTQSLCVRHCPGVKTSKCSTQMCFPLFFFY